MKTIEHHSILAVLFNWESTILDLRATRGDFFVIQWQSYLNELLHIPICTYVESALRHFQETGLPVKSYLRLTAELKLPGEMARELANDFHAHYGGEPRLYPGATLLLRHLCLHYKTAVIGQNREGIVQHRVNRAGIAPYLDLVLMKQSDDSEKAWAETFQRALRELQVPAHRTVYVGDDPATDLLAAARAGLRTIWKRPENTAGPFHPGHADAVIDDIRDLYHALREFAGIPEGKSPMIQNDMSVSTAG